MPLEVWLLSQETLTRYENIFQMRRDQVWTWLKVHIPDLSDLKWRIILPLVPVNGQQPDLLVVIGKPADAAEFTAHPCSCDDQDIHGRMCST